MKRTEKFALALAVSYAIKPLCSFVLVSWIPSMVRSIQDGTTIHTYKNIQAWVAAIGMLGAALISAAWLYTEAKVRGHAKWVWALFGLTCQLTGIAVFYLWVLLAKTQDEEPSREVK